MSAHDPEDCVECANECAKLRAQLATVTRERDDAHEALRLARESLLTATRFSVPPVVTMSASQVRDMLAAIEKALGET